MEPIKLYFDIRDIFRAPRLALSGKKIWIFVFANIIGFVSYWILSYLALGLGGYGISEAWNAYGLYPFLCGSSLPLYAKIIYWLGMILWFFIVSIACTAVARVTYKQLKGDEFYSSKDAWTYVKKHWHPVIFTSISILLIIVFFVAMAAIFALFGKIPFVGEFIFSIPYLFYFFGSVFAVYTAVVFIMAIIYTPAIVAAYEEDTMGAVFQNYSITWSQPWRIILYHVVLILIAFLGYHIFKLFWVAGYELINLVFGYEWLMGDKLSHIVGWASGIVNPHWLCDWASCWGLNWDVLGNCSNAFFCATVPEGAVLSGTELVAGTIVSIFLFLLLVSVFSYGLSIFSVGETLMFVIFKKRSDDDNLLERKDEEELEEEEAEESDETAENDELATDEPEDEEESNKEESEDN